MTAAISSCVDAPISTSGIPRWPFLLSVLAFSLVSLTPCTAASSESPNFLVIISDDQNHGTVTRKWMPHTRREIFDKGIDFKNAFVSNPQCCPSRASLFTGLYSRHNGQLSNNKQHNLNVPTCSFYLRQSGYVTGLVGKYLNSHGQDGYQDFQSQQFDMWYQNSKKKDYTLISEAGTHSEHIDTWVAVKAIEALNRIGSKPFLLFVAFHSPHALTPLDSTHSHLFKYPSPRELASIKPSFNLRPQNKPRWTLRHFNTRNASRAERNSFNKLQSLDTHVKSIIDALRANKQYDNTYIFYISDNGYLYGEHGLSGKSMPYEPAIHVPMAMSGPGISPQRSKAIVSNIDIAPTIYALAGVAGGRVDGINLLSDTRKHLFLEGAYALANGKKQPMFEGVISKRWRLFLTRTAL